MPVPAGGGCRQPCGPDAQRTCQRVEHGGDRAEEGDADEKDPRLVQPANGGWVGWGWVALQRRVRAISPAWAAAAAAACCVRHVLAAAGWSCCAAGREARQRQLGPQRSSSIEQQQRAPEPRTTSWSPAPAPRPSPPLQPTPTAHTPLPVNLRLRHGCCRPLRLRRACAGGCGPASRPWLSREDAAIEGATNVNATDAVRRAGAAVSAAQRQAQHSSARAAGRPRTARAADINQRAVGRPRAVRRGAWTALGGCSGAWRRLSRSKARSTLALPAALRAPGPHNPRGLDKWFTRVYRYSSTGRTPALLTAAPG